MDIFGIRSGVRFYYGGPPAWRTLVDRSKMKEASVELDGGPGTFYKQVYVAVCVSSDGNGRNGGVSHEYNEMSTVEKSIRRGTSVVDDNPKLGIEA